MDAAGDHYGMEEFYKHPRIDIAILRTKTPITYSAMIAAESDLGAPFEAVDANNCMAMGFGALGSEFHYHTSFIG